MAEHRVLYSEHALDRMLDWDISEAEAQAAQAGGETIEEYVDGGRLVLGQAGYALHVVVADRAAVTVVVTAYPPDPSRWDSAFRVRIRP